MHVLTSFTAGQFREISMPKLTVGSHRKALLPIIVIGIGLLAYFAWLYYKEWQMKRKFRRYWEGKSSKTRK
jgi:hypothetical protein